MAEWHVTPDYIVNNWTDELLNLMIEKLSERKKRESEPPPPEEGASVETLAMRSGGMIEVVKGKVDGD